MYTVSDRMRKGNERSLDGLTGEHHNVMMRSILQTCWFLKLVRSPELEKRLRNDATDQLTLNPAAERSRGSFVSASNRKGLRAARDGLALS